MHLTRFVVCNSFSKLSKHAFKFKCRRENIDKKKHQVINSQTAFNRSLVFFFIPNVIERNKLKPLIFRTEPDRQFLSLSDVVSQDRIKNH